MLNMLQVPALSVTKHATAFWILMSVCGGCYADNDLDSLLGPQSGQSQETEKQDSAVPTDSQAGVSNPPPENTVAPQTAHSDLSDKGEQLQHAPGSDQDSALDSLLDGNETKIEGDTAAAQNSSVSDPDSATATYDPIPVNLPDNRQPVSEDPQRKPQQRLEEIIVTAQKREENLREVPIAVSVLSGDDLKNKSISTFDEVARLIPNVSFNTDFNSLYMRGIGTAELNVLSEQAVSYVLDGVYVSRLDYLKPGFMDIGRIEVLKGPQGTLYGRNATAGVINITYAEPTQDWQSSLSISGGQRGYKKAEAVVSGPISDSLSFRLAGNISDEKGYTENLATGGTLGDRRSKQFRAKAHLDISDTLEASLTFNYFDYFIGVWGGNEVFTSPDYLVTVFKTLDPTYHIGLDRTGSANIQNDSSGKGFMIPLQIKATFGETTLTSITAYTKLNDHQGGDLDGSAFDLDRIDGYPITHQISQEFRLVSGPGTFEYVSGLFLYKSVLGAGLKIPILPNLGLHTLDNVNYVGQALQSLQGILGPLGAVTGLVFPGGYGDNLNAAATVDVTSLGLFGQGTWHITDDLSLLVGARLSKDSRHGTMNVTSDGPLPIWTVLANGGYTADRHAANKNFSPKVSMTWNVMDSVTLYGTYAKGFRSGSYNIAAFAAKDFEFNPETSLTYEAGVKTELFDGLIRYNLGVFHTIYTGYQLATFTGFGYDITNAEKVLSEGVESDVTALLYPGLILMAGVGYDHGKYITNTHGGCPTVSFTSSGGIPPQGLAALTPAKTCDLSGRSLFRAPKWTGNVNLNYQAPLFSWPVDVIAGVGATYKGFEYMDSDLDPLDSQNGYWLYNASLGLKSSEDRWSFAIQGKNLSNALVKVFSGDVPLEAGAHWALANPPRTISATLQIKF